MHSLIAFVGNYFVFINVAIVALYWIRARIAKKLSLMYQIVVGGIVAFVLSLVASHLYYDTRPFVYQHIVPLIAHSADNGFPSDHALLGAFLGFTMLLYSKRVGLFLLVIAALVGWARVAAHIHNPRDIVGSFVIAAIAVTVTRLAAKWWQGRKSTSSWPNH
jgi:undecaprenyl-diphosphatase